MSQEEKSEPHKIPIHFQQPERVRVGAKDVELQQTCTAPDTPETNPESDEPEF
jgi:hypothetical protein